MKLLLTAFDPFGGESVNPALEAIRLVPDEVAGWEIAKLEVPTVFGASVDTVAQAIRRETPDAVLCIGQAGGRCDLTPERVAINIDDARIADNAGNQPIDAPIAKDGPAAYFATLPVKAMAAAIREAGLPASVSNTAGTFVCNHLMYRVLHHLYKYLRVVLFLPALFSYPPATPAHSLPSLPSLCRNVPHYESHHSASDIHSCIFHLIALTSHLVR